MSLFRIIWQFIEFLVAIHLTAGNDKTNCAWRIVFILVTKFNFKHKNTSFLYLLYLSILKNYISKRRESDSKIPFREILKSLPTWVPKKTLPYLRWRTDAEVYFFTRSGGCSDDESSDDDRNHEEESSQQCGEHQAITSDIETEKHVTTTDHGKEVESTASQSPESKSVRKRKVDAQREEIGMKRSKFQGRPAEKGIENVSSPLPGVMRQTDFPEPPSPSQRSSSDRSQVSFPGSFGQDSGAATSADVEQVVRRPYPDPDKSTYRESIQLSPPSEESPPSAGSSTSEESSRVKPLDTDTRAHSPEKTDRDSHKKSLSCRSSVQGDNQQRAEEVSPTELQNTVESRASSSRDADYQMSDHRGITRESRKVTMSDQSTEMDISGVDTSSNESRRSREIAEATREFFKTFGEHARPKDPRMSGGNRTGGNNRRFELPSKRIHNEDLITHPLIWPWPSLDRPGPSSEPEYIAIYYNRDKRGNIRYYREYPGLSLQPFNVKKDAIYQKRFYRERKSMFMPIKMGEMIRWAISLAQDLADNIPRYSMSDEEKLTLGDYHGLSQQLIQGFVKTYRIVEEGKNLRNRNTRPPEQRKIGYVTSSFQEESPSNSSDETICSPTLSSASSEEDRTEHCVIPTKAGESASHSMNLPMPHFSFEWNVSRDQPQATFLQASAPEVAGPSTSHHQPFQRNPEHRIRVYRHGSYSNPGRSVQPVQIKFVPETSRRSTRLIYCRDIMSSASYKDSRILLKPFFEVEEVLQLEQRTPSVSVEEFLHTLYTFQELYYQLLYDESGRFYTVRQDMYRCVIPMRNFESYDDEFDENNPKPSTSGAGQSSKSLDSSEEVSSSTSGINIARQLQTRNNNPSGRQEKLEDDNMQLANNENMGQAEKSMPQPEISIPLISSTGLISTGRTWEMSVNRSESRGSSRSREFALGSDVGTSVNEKRKHVVWYPPPVEEADDKGTGVDCPANDSETESASD